MVKLTHQTSSPYCCQMSSVNTSYLVLFSRCYFTFHVAMLLFAILSGTQVTPTPAALPSSAVASPGEAEDPDIHHECDM